MRWAAVLLIAIVPCAIAAPKEKDKGKVDISLTAPAAGASYTAPAAIVRNNEPPPQPTQV